MFIKPGAILDGTIELCLILARTPAWQGKGKGGQLDRRIRSGENRRPVSRSLDRR